MIRHCLKRFARDAEGTVTIEFLLTFPLLVLWLLGSYVFFDLYKSESKASKAGYAIADIISRQVSVTEDDLDNYYVLLDNLLPRASDRKWMRVTSISYDQDLADYVVNWSWVEDPGNGVEGLTNEDVPDIDMPSIAADDSVIYLEINVPYQPIITNLGFTDQVWKPRVIVRPRFIDKVACVDCP